MYFVQKNNAGDKKKSNNLTALKCVVPENIQTPHHGGNWKLQEGGGVRGLGNSRREGGWTIKSLSKGAISFCFRPEFEHCFLPTW